MRENLISRPWGRGTLSGEVLVDVQNRLGVHISPSHLDVPYKLSKSQPQCYKESVAQRPLR